MRFILYNIKYATGPKAHSFIGPTRRNLNQIAYFLRDLEPDLVGLIEVDHGSYRCSGLNQVELLADLLGHYHSHSVKYGQNSFWRRVPVLKNQGNAFLARDRIRNETFHYFNKGMKRLAIELEMEHLVIYLVHLSLGAKARHNQLGDLYKMVKTTTKPCIVAGDFNVLWGEQEIDLFLAATGLKNANTQNLPTFPSKQPRRHLDFILHSKEIDIQKLEILPVHFSDHLPVMIDFNVMVEGERRSEPRGPHCSCLEKERELFSTCKHI